jgi:hypothetical protein
VTWQDVGSPIEPGLYEFDDGVLYVKQRELDVWKEHPNALFAVSPFAHMSDPSGMSWEVMSCRWRMNSD